MASPKTPREKLLSWLDSRMDMSKTWKVAGSEYRAALKALETLADGAPGCDKAACVDCCKVALAILRGEGGSE